MADLLYDLLAKSKDGTAADLKLDPKPDPDALAYLATLVNKPLSSLQTSEPQALTQESQSHLLALQGLARQSYEQILDSSRRYESLRRGLPELAARTAELKAALPALDSAVDRFAAFKSSGGLARRRQALLLGRNAERLVDVLELPSLLASATGASSSLSSLSSTSASSGLSSSHSTAAANYTAALDLNSHIRRLHALYPQSPLVQSVAAAADESMRAAAASLILSLKSPGLKLAASLRTVSWLRRVLPDLEATAAAAAAGSATAATPVSTSQLSTFSTTPSPNPSQERTLGAVFLVCRLATLTNMLDALAPLRELADQERVRQQQQQKQQQQKEEKKQPPHKRTSSANAAWSGGQQTERYLKRYIEIFREQSFAIVSMFRSIFPSTDSSTGEKEGRGGGGEEKEDRDDTEEEEDKDSTYDPLEPLPSAIAGFPLHLVDLLLVTLRRYLPTVRDQAARDSLLTQVLYCAGSLGRLGGDFGLFLATLDVGQSAEEEWEEVVKRHHQLAGRLESIVGEKKK